jgi:hypothetical protein
MSMSPTTTSTTIAAGDTASVNVSTDGGHTFTPTVIDRIGGAQGQDAPAVRLDVNGDRVYAIYTRWNTAIESDSNGARYGSQVVVVRSDDGGADRFTALGLGGNGTVVASTNSVFANTTDTALTLGQERIAGGDSAIAIDPNDVNHVIVAYQSAPGANGSGFLELVVAESTDGGATWTTRYTTGSATRSAQPGLAILDNGTIGLLYDNYNPATDALSQHFLTTSDDFTTTIDTVLATEQNTAAPFDFHPYLGDFFDLHALGDTFYGMFSAANADNGAAANFLNLSLDRHYTGTPGTATFQLTDAAGQPVSFSVDPYLFIDVESAATELRSHDFNADRLADLAFQTPDNRFLVSLSTATGTSFTAPQWWMQHGGGFVAGEAQYADVNDDGRADLIYQGLDNRFWVSTSTGTAFSPPQNLVTHGGGFIPGEAQYADVNGDGRADLIYQGLDNRFWVSTSSGTGFSPPQNWVTHGGGFIPGEAQYADVNGDGRADLI